MTAAEIDTALSLVREEQDLNAKALLLAGLVSELFRERGFEPVVVGGSAIEFYTDGAYMSGDTDICWAGWPVPNMEQKGEVMRQIPGIESRSGGKSWRVEDLWIDLLGAVEHLAQKDFFRILTPYGEVVLIPAEDALVERVYSARKWTGYNEGEDACAKKLMVSVLTGQIPFDWDEALQIADSPKFRCVEEFNAVRAEVQEELEKPQL